MKEQVFYDPKTDRIGLALKDYRYFERGRWQQAWWIKDEVRIVQPMTDAKAAKFLKRMITLESARYLDEYR